jgi:hypothetical protein
MKIHLDKIFVTNLANVNSPIIVRILVGDAEMVTDRLVADNLVCWIVLIMYFN